MWSAHDRATCTELGIALDALEPPKRSAWAPERLLQAAADGHLLVPHPRYCTADEIPVSLDGRDATETECRVLVDMLMNGLLAWSGIELTPSPQGARVLDQWSRYAPLGGGSGR